MIKETTHQITTNTHIEQL